MTDEVTLKLRKMTRQRMHDIWEIAKTGDLDVLNGDDKRLAQAMLEHQEEYSNQFEIADLTYDHEFDAETEGNPFLHITLHVVVENQLEAKEPIEAYQFYNSMRGKKYSHHNTVHLIASILAPLIVSALQRNRAPGMKKYRSLLKKHKNKRPEKIWSLLDRDLDPLFQD